MKMDHDPGAKKTKPQLKTRLETLSRVKTVHYVCIIKSVACCAKLHLKPGKENNLKSTQTTSQSDFVFPTNFASKASVWLKIIWESFRFLVNSCSTSANLSSPDGVSAEAAWKIFCFSQFSPQHHQMRDTWATCLHRRPHHPHLGSWQKHQELSSYFWKQ